MEIRNHWRLVALVAALVGFAAAGQREGPGLQSVMREKLLHSQKILEAVVTSDWRSLGVQSQQLERLTNDPRWTVLKYPEYARHSEEFRQAVQELRAAAEQRDLEKTPQAYNTMITRCIECHRSLARARIAQ